MPEELAVELDNKNSGPLISDRTIEQPQNLPIVTYRLADKGVKEYLGLKLGMERKSPESDLRTASSTSNSKKLRANLRSKKLKSTKKTGKAYCPYCVQKIEMSGNNFDKHLAACFKKEEEAKSRGKRKRAERVVGKTDRYSPETYSERVYRYLKQLNSIHS